MKLFAALLLNSALLAQTPNLDQLKKEAIAGVELSLSVAQSGT